MGIITADHLDRWSSSIAGRNKLGELIRRLIHSTVPRENIRMIRFLSDEANQLSGWDGVLDCDSQGPWVLTGTSVWELGTGRSERAKIRDDFIARRDRELLDGWQRDATVYVAVTLRKLNDLDILQNGLKEESPWRDVRIYDAQSLAEWIELCPSVQAWLQDQGVGPPITIRTIKGVWDVWSQSTQPPVLPGLVLAGREKVVRDFRAALQTSATVTSVQGDSTGEAVAFIFAAMSAENDQLREYFVDRSIVVTTLDDAEQLRHYDPQCVVLLPPATEKAQLLARVGHTVINALGNSAQTRTSVYRIPRPRRDEFANALVEMGVPRDEAEIDTRACGSSPAVWRIWKLQQQADVASQIPEWAALAHSDIVVPAVLLGGWSERFDGDKEIILEMTGYDFDAYRDRLHPYISMDDPLLVTVDDASIVTAPAAAFALVVPHITRGHLERLSEIVKKVFGEIDPTIDLAPSERPYAALRNIGMRYSTWLRDGLAETLLRIVVIGHRLERTGVIPGSQGCQGFVDQLIRQLPGLSDDWRLITSLRDTLPVLAEAAPNPFLETLEHLLQGPLEKIWPIFAEDDGLFGHANHPALWWTLETLAWEPTYLGRVGLILARFAKIDPGGRLTNRPINTLRGIFLAWNPGTSASLDQRLQALDAILDNEPEVGWELLLALMPKSYGDTGFPTREPIWKDFSRSERAVMTRGIVLQAYQDYIDRAIFHAGLDPLRCRQLIQFYSEVSADHQRAIQERLAELATANLSNDDRVMIWNALRDFVNHHQRFADAAWALNPDKLQRLDEIKDRFASSNPVERAVWLFNSQFPDIPITGTDFHRIEAELAGLRKAAVEEIWRSGGIALIKEFLDQVQYPGLVSPSLLEALGGEAEVRMTFQETSEGSTNQKFFARCLSSDAHRRFGGRWTSLVISLSGECGWSAPTMANAFLNYPDTSDTYELIGSLGPEVEGEYWQAKQWVFPEADTVGIAVDKLMWAGRALDAIDLVQRRFDAFESAEVLRVLDQCLQELNEGKMSKRHDAFSWIDRTFDLLLDRGDLDDGELARREYAFLPLLTRAHSKKNLTLHKLLSTEPKFFSDVICDLYKPASRNREDDEAISDIDQRRAEFAWQLLSSWHRPPGLDEAGQVDAGTLRTWVTEARRLANDRDRKTVTDQHIGNVLYYLPADPNDRAWPHTELRKVIEEVASDDLEQGIASEQFNSREVVTYGPYEGGEQERAIGERWRGFANTVGLRWPRTRAMLERIASGWDKFGAHRDSEAEKERLRSV